MWLLRLLVIFCLSCTLAALDIPVPKAWVPIRWTGGPLEIAWRARTKTLPADAAVRDSLARWYEPATLNLLEDSPVNCLLVTWSAPADTAVETEQQQLVKVYAQAAHKRGLAVLGLVYAAGDASKIAADAARAALDGLVLEGQFTPESAAALRKVAGPMLVVEIARDAAPWRWKPAPVVAVAGVAPRARNLSEMGIRGAPSSEPWIESNIWLVRSFGLASPSPTVWISSQLENASAVDYTRAVADAAAAGGRWIVSLDDALRAKLRARDATALETWRRLSSYLRFAEDHASWRALAPYGNVGIVLDAASTKQVLADEFLNLATRRQVPYHPVARSGLNAAALAKFRAVVVTELDPPPAVERKLVQDFAENGGLVIAGPSWGGAPQTEPFAEVPTGKGRVVVYRDPDPETVARDLKELLSDDDLGVVPFNVPSVITFASGDASLLVMQLLNYFDHPVEMVTLRVAGKFRSARLETPEGAPVDLPLRDADGRMEVTIPKLSLWGAVFDAIRGEKLMRQRVTRRDWLALSALAVGAVATRPAEGAGTVSVGPAEPVAVAKVRSYDEDLTARFRQMFDQIGGIGNQVKGKTVGIKVNLTGGGGFPGYTAGDTHWVHPRVVGAVVAAFGALGAKRIRILESAGGRKPGYKLEDKLLSGGWDVAAIRNAAPLVEFEDTNALGQGKQYSLLKVKSKPYIFPAFELNHSYEDCDFFVSLGKMKNHEEMGLTICIKNLFGITPLGMYGNRETVFHYGQVQAPSGAPAELDPKSNRYEGWRLPRILVDILGARPVDLAIADGIVSMVGGEGPWVLGSKPAHPGLLVVGRNCVNTDAVAAATMGYNPRAGRNEAPYRVFKDPKHHPPEQLQPGDEMFQYADNMMLLAEAVGLGSADLKKIDVRGVPIKEAMFDYEAFWKNQIPKVQS